MPQGGPRQKPGPTIKQATGPVILNQAGTSGGRRYVSPATQASPAANKSIYQTAVDAATQYIFRPTFQAGYNIGQGIGQLVYPAIAATKGGPPAAAGQAALYRNPSQGFIPSKPIQIYGPGYSSGASQTGQGATPAEVYSARYSGLAGYYERQTAKTATQTTPGVFNQDRANLASAARYSGISIFQYGVRPDTMTTRIAEELPFASAGFNSAEEFLLGIGYREDPSQPGVWKAYDVGQPTIAASDGGYVDTGYPGTDYGGGGYGDGNYGGRGYGGDGAYGGGIGLMTWNIRP